jgi:hypothetical protein
MDPVPSQPGALVEAMGRSARGTEPSEQRQAGAQRRRTAERQLQLHRLARTQVAPAEDESPHAKLERALARRLLDLDHGALRGPDARSQHAVVDHGEAGASVPPAGDSDAEADQRERCRSGGGRRAEGKRRRGHQRGRHETDAHSRGGSEAETERTAERVRDSKGQGITRPFS